MKAQGKNDLADRTKAFALDVIRMTDDLPRTTSAQVLRQTAFAFRDFDRSKLSRSFSRALETGVYCQDWRLLEGSGRDRLLARVAARFSGVIGRSIRTTPGRMSSAGRDPRHNFKARAREQMILLLFAFFLLPLFRHRG